MLRRSQYICVLALVNARFSILKKQKPTKNTISFFFLLGQEIRDSNDSNFRETPCLFVFIYDRGAGAQRIGDWYCVKSIADVPDGKMWVSFVANDRRLSQKSGTHRENGNPLDSPELSPSIPDNREYLQFVVFISRHNLGQSGNSKIPDRLVFSRHIKNRLKEKE